MHDQYMNDSLRNYLLLLKKWNQAYNLTAIRELNDMVILHIFDSLAIQPLIRGSRVLDVGSGAGFPGVPLAIANPNAEFVLVDSNGKKTRFIDEVKRNLNLDNLTIIQTRIENYRPPYPFDTIVSRAFSDISTFMKLTKHCLASDGGIWLAMKGLIPHAELSVIKHIYKIHSYTLPQNKGARCCIIIDCIP